MEIDRRKRGASLKPTPLELSWTRSCSAVLFRAAVAVEATNPEKRGGVNVTDGSTV
jgi:hypothetical protein